MKTRSECLSEYGSDYKIQQKIDARELYRVGKAIYSEKEHVPELAVLALKYPKAVVTMRSAFYMHGLTDVIPDEYDFATERDAAKIRDERIKQFFSPDGFFKQGAITIDYRGYPIRIYNKERMLIELLRYKSKLPFDYYKEVLLNYRRIMPQLNIQMIQDYTCEAPKSGKIMETLQIEVL